MSTGSPLGASLLPWQRRIAQTLREAAERGESVSICVPPQNGRSSISRTSPSEHLGSCGHELDPWESHLEHAPDCRRELCIDDSHCTCPEVCPDCCTSCGYDLAERMGS